jgi:hypothetical protein
MEEINVTKKKCLVHNIYIVIHMQHVKAVLQVHPSKR